MWTEARDGELTNNGREPDKGWMRTDPEVHHQALPHYTDKGQYKLPTYTRGWTKGLGSFESSGEKRGLVLPGDGSRALCQRTCRRRQHRSTQPIEGRSTSGKEEKTLFGAKSVRKDRQRAHDARHEYCDDLSGNRVNATRRIRLKGAVESASLHSASG